MAVTPHVRTMRVLSLIGWLMLAAGALCVVAAVLEIGAYGQFAEGGRFHYDGYGPGSVMFALIALSLLAYAGLAAIMLPLGYGHVRRRAWSVLIAEALTWTWMVVGLPLLAGAVVLTLMFKASFSIGGFLLMGTAIMLSYPVAPLILLRLYRRARACAALSGDVSTAPPLSARGPAALLAFLAAPLLLPTLLGSPFPWFGGIVTGSTGLALLFASAVGLSVAAWGVLRCRQWGWWSAGALLAMLAVSATVTVAAMTVGETIAAMDLAPVEAEWFAELPFLDAHPVALVVAPFGVVAIVLLVARRVAASAPTLPGSKARRLRAGPRRTT